MSSAGSLFSSTFRTVSIWVAATRFQWGWCQQEPRQGSGESRRVQHCVNLWRLQSLKWNQVNGESMFTFNILRNRMIRHFYRNCNDLCWCVSVSYVAGLHVYKEQVWRKEKCAVAYILSTRRTHDGKVVGWSPWLLANHEWDFLWW